jgi:hypothetical protein
MATALAANIFGLGVIRALLGTAEAGFMVGQVCGIVP